MPGNVVKTPADEIKWQKAKKIAEDRGKKENWPYIMAIYKRLKAGKKRRSKHMNKRALMELILNCRRCTTFRR
jgi:arginyl-tRNA--protein-N-Asp/Glu arginylyltransferase